jgi:D-erythrulose 1-phosphate 3-epimerase
MAKLELGINNYFAVKRWPEPEEWLAIVRKDLGLGLAQFDLDLLDPHTIEPVRSLQTRRIREAAARQGVRIQSLLTGGVGYHMSLLLHPDQGMRASGLDWFQNAAVMAGTLGAECVGGPLGALSMRDYGNVARRDYLLACLRDSLHAIGEVGKREGLSYLIWEANPVRREWPATIAEAQAMDAYVNDGAPLPVQFLVDLGHACNFEAAGEDRDPYAWIRRFGKRCPIIHLQQTDGKGDRHWPFTPEFNRQGIITAEKVLEAIAKAGIEKAHLVLEIIPAFEAREDQVLDDLKSSVEYWQKALS